MVDIQKMTNFIQAKTMVSLLVGLEYSEKYLKHVNLKTGEETQILLCEFFDILLEDMMKRIMGNPLILLNPDYAEKEMTKVDSRYFENSRTIRGFLEDIIADKKRQADPEASDVISLILQDPSY